MLVAQKPPEGGFCFDWEPLSDMVFYMALTNVRICEYNAVFEPAEEGGYDVSFPAFPGCVTFGRTFEEAEKMAQEVLGLWIEELTRTRMQKPPEGGFCRGERFADFHPLVRRAGAR